MFESQMVIRSYPEYGPSYATIHRCKGQYCENKNFYDPPEFITEYHGADAAFRAGWRQDRHSNWYCPYCVKEIKDDHTSTEGSSIKA